MDIENLIEQVTQEVLKYMSRHILISEILLLTTEKGGRSQEVLAGLEGTTATCDWNICDEGREDSIHTIILFDVTNDVLYKLAHGCSDTKYLQIATTALLRGKRVILIKEEIECFNYEKTAPKLYFKKFMEYIDFLKQCGVEIICCDELKDYLKEPQKRCSIEHTILDEPVCEEIKARTATNKTHKLCKKLITDKDIKMALRAGAKVIEINQGAIITELAKDSIKAYNIQVIKKS